MKAANVAAQAFVRTLSKVVGAEVIDDAITFFTAFSGMEEGFKDRANTVFALLASPNTAFVVASRAATPSRKPTSLLAACSRRASTCVDRQPDASEFGDGMAEATRERRAHSRHRPRGPLRQSADFRLVARAKKNLVGLAEHV
jgi:hypothetical protein